MTRFEGVDAEDVRGELALAAAVFLTLLAIWEVVQSLAAGDGDRMQRRTEQSVALPEDALRRLENGEKVVVPRWHGHDLELSGTQVIDVEPVDENVEGDP